MALLSCLSCGRRDHPAQFCPNLPPDVADRLSGEGETESRALEWGDTLTLHIPNDEAEEALFLGVCDADHGTTATAALNLDEAERLGAELVMAAVVKRGQRVGSSS